MFIFSLLVFTIEDDECLLDDEAKFDALVAKEKEVLIGFHIENVFSNRLGKTATKKRKEIHCILRLPGIDIFSLVEINIYYVND